MRMSCNSRHLPRYLEQPRPKSWSPGGIEYHDTESRSDSDSTLSSSQNSFSTPLVNAQRRGVKSFGDLGDEFNQREGHSRLPSQDPFSLNPTASDSGDRTEVTPSDVDGFCEICLGMSAENLAQPGGYKHHMLSDLFKHAKSCKLCDIIEWLFLNAKFIGYTRDRYQIVVSLGETGEGVEARPDSEYRRRPRSPTGHGKSRAQFKDDYSRLEVDLIDLRPWEAPDTIDGAPVPFSWTCLAPDGSKLRKIRVDSLFCLTEEHDPAMELGVKYIRQIGSDTSSPRSFEIAAGWLTSCLSAENPPALEDWKLPNSLHLLVGPYRGHEAGDFKVVASDIAAASLRAQDPLRLVEIQPGRGGMAPDIRLIHTDGHNYPYAALSYCWGKAQPGDSRPWQTKHATLKSHLQGINKRHLPRTLQDAITICERLHISYLWVDSLCIIQDSTSDWAVEAAKMSGIYMGSLLTISLSASVSAESGCFNNASQRIVESEFFQDLCVELDTRFRDGRSSRLYIRVNQFNIPPRLFEDEVRSGVLSQRAWALQEHIMPKRTLYITSKQLLWECGHCRLSEDNFPQEQEDWLYPIFDYSFALDATAIIQMWYKRVVVDYTRRQLTCEQDKLIAISALARATYSNRHIAYVAGLWRDCIVPGLLWMRTGPGCKSKTYSCPTWSWASQNSAVTYRLASGYEPGSGYSESFPRIQDVSWATKPENPFGDVLFAYVDLDTTIALGSVLRDNSFYRSWHSETCTEQTLIIPGPGQNGTICADVTMDDADGGGRNVVVANMGHCLLLLEPPSLGSEEYRRVGVAVLYTDIEVDSYDIVNIDEISFGWTQRTIRLA